MAAVEKKALAELPACIWGLPLQETAFLKPESVGISTKPRANWPLAHRIRLKYMYTAAGMLFLKMCMLRVTAKLFVVSLQKILQIY